MFRKDLKTILILTHHQIWEILFDRYEMYPRNKVCVEMFIVFRICFENNAATGQQVG